MAGELEREEEAVALILVSRVTTPATDFRTAGAPWIPVEAPLIRVVEALWTVELAQTTLADSHTTPAELLQTPEEASLI